MTALEEAGKKSEAGARSRHPILLVYRAMRAFFRVDAMQGLAGERITDPQAADVEARARERFEALLVQFLTTRQPTCMPSFSSVSYQMRLLVSSCEALVHLLFICCCRCLLEQRMHSPAMQSVDPLDYDDTQVAAVTQEAASARVVNAAEERFWHGRRMAAAATNNQ